MVIHGVTIDDEKSFAAAKKKFRLCKSRWGKQGKLDFDEILDRLIRGDSLSSIARAHGVSRQMMSKDIIYPYFRKWLPGAQEDGRQRRKFHTIERVAAKAREVLNRSALAFVLQEAKRLGYDAEPVQRNLAQQAGNEQLFFHRNQVRLGGKLCLLHHLTLTTSSAEGTQEHGQLRFPPNSKSIEFRIVVTDFLNRPRRIFIFPTEILPKSGTLDIPADKISKVHRNHHRTIDCWEYEGDAAWHQFDQFIKT